jgi:hypothetical protein
LTSFETITVAGEGDRCYSCFNRETADRLGVAFDTIPLVPIVLADAEGVPHTFEIRSMLVATGHEMEALEITKGRKDRQLGYRFSVLGDHEADAWELFQHLYTKMRSDMATPPCPSSGIRVAAHR